jgi:hypothetical protein
MHLRRLLIPLTLGAALWAPAAHAAPSADVRMLSCIPWQPDEGGSVTYEARMRSVPGTARMAMRFRVFEKTGEEFDRVSTKEVWRTSRVGAAAFVWEHRVRGLRQGAAYRVVVDYRWLAADGGEVQSARRRSPVCRQEAGLPNLRVASIDVRPGEVEESAVYKVKVANRGDATARRVGVLLRVDGEVVDEVEVIEALQPGETQTVSFSGPVCRRKLRVVVDPKELIAESREEDNVRDPACL